MSHTSIKPGQFYYHFKQDKSQGVEHGAYYVLGLGMDTEDRSKLSVVYKPLYFCDPRHADEVGISYQLRPLDNFLESVDRKSYQGPRFTLITDPDIIEQLRHAPLFGSDYLDDQ